jgi:hypothetical protein
MTDVERSNHLPIAIVEDTAQQGNLDPGPLAPLLDACLKDFSEAGLIVDRPLLSRFVASLLAKRFVLLTGLSGSGKTRLAQAIARWLTNAAGTQGDPFTPGAVIPGVNLDYVVRRADSFLSSLPTPTWCEWHCHGS